MRENARSSLTRRLMANDRVTALLKIQCDWLRDNNLKNSEQTKRTGSGSSLHNYEIGKRPRYQPTMHRAESASQYGYTHQGVNPLEARLVTSK